MGSCRLPRAILSSMVVRGQPLMREIAVQHDSPLQSSSRTYSHPRFLIVHYNADSPRQQAIFGPGAGRELFGSHRTRRVSHFPRSCYGFKTSGSGVIHQGDVAEGEVSGSVVQHRSAGRVEQRTGRPPAVAHGQIGDLHLAGRIERAAGCARIYDRSVFACTVESERCADRISCSLYTPAALSIRSPRPIASLLGQWCDRPWRGSGNWQHRCPPV